MMKKMIAVLALLVGFQAQAGLITLSTDSPTVGVDDATTVTLTGSGFTSINALSLFLDFDSSVFEFDSTSIATSFFGLPLTTPVATGVSLAFIGIPAVMTDFTISFDLTAIGLGDGSLDLSNVVAGFQESFFTPPTLESVEVTGTQVEVATPATLGLFLMSGLAMLRLRRKG